MTGERAAGAGKRRVKVASCFVSSVDVCCVFFLVETVKPGACKASREFEIEPNVWPLRLTTTASGKEGGADSSQLCRSDWFIKAETQQKGKRTSSSSSDEGGCGRRQGRGVVQQRTTKREKENCETSSDHIRPWMFLPWCPCRAAAVAALMDNLQRITYLLLYLSLISPVTWPKSGPRRS